MIELNCNYIEFLYNNYIAKFFFFAPQNIYLKEMEKNLFHYYNFIIAYCRMKKQR